MTDKNLMRKLHMAYNSFEECESYEEKEKLIIYILKGIKEYLRTELDENVANEIINNPLFFSNISNLIIDSFVCDIDDDSILMSMTLPNFDSNIDADTCNSSILIFKDLADGNYKCYIQNVRHAKNNLDVREYTTISLKGDSYEKDTIKMRYSNIKGISLKGELVHNYGYMIFEGKEYTVYNKTNTKICDYINDEESCKKMMLNHIFNK